MVSKSHSSQYENENRLKQEAKCRGFANSLVAVAVSYTHLVRILGMVIYLSMVYCALGVYVLFQGKEERGGSSSLLLCLQETRFAHKNQQQLFREILALDN